MLRNIKPKQIFAALLILGLGIGSWIMIANRNIPKTPAEISRDGAGGGKPRQQTDSSAQPQSDSPASSQNSPTASSASANSIPKPTGQLLSKHTVSLSSVAGETSPDEESTCQSVSGATCEIKLTGPNGMVKYVGRKSMQDQNNGNSIAIYNWNAKDLGLTAGRWKVEALASYGGATATSDPDYLRVNS